MKNTLSVGLLALLATSVLGQAKLTGFETAKVGDGLQVVIQGQGLTNPKVTRVMGNTSYIVEFNANLIGKHQYQKIGYAGVQFVQCGWYKAKPPIVRVHVKTNGQASPTLTQLNGNWIISVGTLPVTLSTTPNPINTTATIVPVKKLTTDDQDAMARAERELQQPTSTTPTIPATTIAPSATITAPKTIVTGSADAKTIEKLPFVTSKGTAASLSEDFEPKTQQSIQTPRMRPLTGGARVTQQKVSLDFVGTDIVQIIKALSIQAGVNIVSSPDVSPTDKPVKLTISLSNVELESALSYVTAMASLRYARIGDTYVVAPVNSFSRTMRQIMERNSDSYQTRVVNLMSGEAEKIREATLKAMPPDGRNGFYEIIVPGVNDVTMSDPMPAIGGEGKVEGGQEGQPGNGQTKPQDQGMTSTGGSKVRAYYLLVVGEPTRLASVEDYIRELDVKVAASFSLSRAQSTGTVAIPIQSGQTEKIKSMIEKLLAGNPRAGDYSITESSVKELEQGEQATKFLLMIGPDSELATLKSFAIALDRELCRPLGIDYAEDVQTLVKDYEIVELSYLEPVIAAQDLKGRFKDLWVTVVPDNVTPGLKGEQETKKDEAPTDPNAAGGAAQEKSESKLKKEIGREPMRLILRGSKTTIAEAKRYLALVDIAPRQIALEMRVMDISKEDALSFGLDWSLGLGGTGLVSFKNAPGSANTVTGNIGSLGVTAALDSISNNRNLIARPNALVTDGREAHLFVGDTIRYIKQIQSTQQGITVITDEINVGSQFDIKARIGDKGSIALDLGQKFTLLTSFTDIPGGGKLPQTSDRSSNMFVNMKSGETIAIGGLILETDFKNYSGIPILKDLPIIGRLFGKTNNSKNRTEIVFFLTAVEVSGGNRADAASPRRSERLSPDPIGEYKKTGKNKLN